ncbi:MAG: hypothetical protein OdinLCB4_004315 [Candidatus Odinarchaeum yellowstonii]|uniref:VapC9 PIN-like domain-containing protein n=1 Tax=Odinarchaeota yellowstonii (strain LCB_4) TaxID=1841599 RepID=A0AAF0IAH4_ODILC|nr:MAG: hypothetical protein OdinLCB4_004315 [Candidatus Odinarchaeum yellowstonii]
MFKKLLIDTNFLILPLKIGKNLIRQIDDLLKLKYSIIVLEDSINELKYANPRFFEKLLSDNTLLDQLWPGIKIVKFNYPTGYEIDDKILTYAVENKCVVATNDTTLRARLREKGVPTIYLKHKSHLALEGNLP